MSTGSLIDLDDTNLVSPEIQSQHGTNKLLKSESFESDLLEMTDEQNDNANTATETMEPSTEERSIEEEEENLKDFESVAANLSIDQQNQEIESSAETEDSPNDSVHTETKKDDNESMPENECNSPNGEHQSIQTNDFGENTTDSFSNNDNHEFGDFEDTLSKTESSKEGNDTDFASPTEQDDSDDFGDFDDGFVEATEDDDEFGDFDDFEQSPEQRVIPEEPVQAKGPTDAELCVQVLDRDQPHEISQFIDGCLDRIYANGTIKNENEFTSSPLAKDENPKSILCTPCSQDLWIKLSRDTVFYNPVTGAVGQFQWTRSETNKAYLNALGVTFVEEKISSNNIHSFAASPNSQTISPKKRQTASIIEGMHSSASSESISSEGAQMHTRSASANNGLRVVTSNKMDEKAKEAKKEAEQEMELDIDIARAYCELTEETIRVFPDVKLNSMVTELTRLQKQSVDYLDNLLDRREQLKMDAETYNDLISCIVEHAQRLHVQSKGATPAMVSKKKKPNSTFSNLIRRKTSTNNGQSVSMGGGVVGIKQQQGGPTPKRTVSTASNITTTLEGRRSM